MKPLEQYLDHIDGIAGEKGTYFRISEGSDSPVVIAAYKEVPEPECLTAFTFGLSCADHPEWTHGRPELVICVDSTDYAWALAMGEMVKNGRDDNLFSFGTILNFGMPVSNESAMSAFLVFACTMLEYDDAKVVLSDRTVHLSQLYPIYVEEIPLIKKIGPEKFHTDLGVDFFNTRRTPVISV